MAETPAARRSALSLILIFSFFLHVRGTCYLQNGAHADYTVLPCNPDSEVSACCALNKTSPDICMDSGLCYATDGEVQGRMYQVGCTDASGKDAACPQYCDPVRDALDGIGGFIVMPCGQDLWCCQDAQETSKSCCDTTSLLVPSGGPAVIGHPTSSSTQQSTASSTSSSAGKTTSSHGITQETTTCKSEDEDQNGSSATCSNSSVIGVGAGLGSALALALGAIAYLLLKRPKAIQSTSGYQGYKDSSQVSHEHYQLNQPGGYGGGALEIDGIQKPAELSHSFIR